ncbi:hypothetical protein P4E94_17200 [Pontiellaceae bacterium B12219]|nr:hypothetical protein [Pontiellaceae bacterium B12219]
MKKTLSAVLREQVGPSIRMTIKRIIPEPLACFFLFFLLSQNAQSQFRWTSNGEGLFRDGVPFFLRGQSWAKKTAFTYDRGSGSDVEAEVKEVLNSLSAIGVNVIRIYGSPDESEWAGAWNYHNLITWIEEWNVANPDGGDPNKAMYYLIQLSPSDPQSSISDGMPERSAASFERAIHDSAHRGSIVSMVESIETLTGGSMYLLGYLIYHELNISTKYDEWRNTIGAQGIEDFMNAAADALHETYAPGKLVTHTGDAKDTAGDIYDEIESLDEIDGNVFGHFDLIGFNLYISTDALLEQDKYYDRITRRRSISVNPARTWYIGETGASYDESANPRAVALANHSNAQGGANLQLMWNASRALGNMAGFMLFTVQDNDLGESIGNQIKQRGFYDCFGDRKFLYFIYPDVVNEESANCRWHNRSQHNLGVSISESATEYIVEFLLHNKSAETQNFRWSIFRDNGGNSRQRFSELVDDDFEVLAGGATKTVVRKIPIPDAGSLFVATASQIIDLRPRGAYRWGREHLLGDAVCTVFGMSGKKEGASGKRAGSVK